MNSRILTGQKKPLYVALHESKERRRSKLAGNLTKNVRGGQPVYGQGHIYYNGNVPQSYYYTQQGVLTVPATRSPWHLQPVPQTNYLPGIVNQAVRGNNASSGSSRPSNSSTAPSSGINRTQQQQQQQQQQQRAGGGSSRNRGSNRQQPQMENPPMDLAKLAHYPADQQKLIIGEKLYPIIYNLQGSFAGKITGMFLDSGWTIEELLSLIHDEHKLRQKIENALEVLARAQESMEDPSMLNSQST